MPIYYLFEGNYEWFNCDSFDDLKKLYNYHDIVRIDCWNNPAFILPSALPNSLKYLDCSDNNLIALPTLPPNLNTLKCPNNKLTLLPDLPNSLEYLYCHHNELTLLPTLPNNLQDLACYDNQLILLPNIPYSLIHLVCSFNRLTFLPILPDNLTYKKYYDNPVDTYIKEKCGGNLEIYHRVNEIFATKLVRWYLDCRENPVYKFCRERLDREYDELMEEDVDGIMN